MIHLDEIHFIRWKNYPNKTLNIPNAYILLVNGIFETSFSAFWNGVSDPSLPWTIWSFSKTEIQFENVFTYETKHRRRKPYGATSN